jgi:hypothetical protein
MCGENLPSRQIVSVLSGVSQQIPVESFDSRPEISRQGAEPIPEGFAAIQHFDQGL